MTLTIRQGIPPRSSLGTVIPPRAQATIPIQTIEPIMAKCDQGYLCESCGLEVTSIVDSDLYLRFVIGQLDAERLHLSPERHLRCNPSLSQYIADARFDPVVVEGDFDHRQLDPEFVARQFDRITRGYQRLWTINQSPEPISLLDYPIPDDDNDTAPTAPQAR